MGIKIDLPDELENELAAEANRMGLSLSDYIVHLLSTRSLVGPPPATGAELVAYWRREGVIGTRKDIKDSESHARNIRHQAERRRGQ
jgi:hypothetical protein